MSKVIEGQVKWVSDEKKYGNYSFKLVDNEKWFRSQKRMADVLQPGYTVKVKVTENDRGDYELEAAPKLVEKGELKKKGYGGKGGFGGKRDPEVEKRIVMQHSQEMGIAAAALIIEKGGVKVPAKPDAAKTVIEGLIDEQVARFYKQSFDVKSVLGKADELAEDLGEDKKSDTKDEEDSWDESGDADTGDKDDGDDVAWDKE